MSKAKTSPRQAEDFGIGRFGRQALPPLPDLSARQQVEGYAETVSQPGIMPNFNRKRPRHVADYRGPGNAASTREWWRPRSEEEPELVWLTAAVPEAVDTTFTFAGASASLPENDFPANQATLYANDVRVLSFDLGLQTPGAWADGDWALEFAPKQTRSAIDGYHRQFEASGCSGVYRLAAPAAALTVGQPLSLKVVPDTAHSKAPNWFAVLERADILETTLETNASEIEQLQHEIIRLKQLFGGLARRNYPELFPERLDTEDVIIYTNGWAHVHPPDVELLENNDLLVSFREASEHLANDGKIVTVRSTDGGKSWGDYQVVHGGEFTDVRDASIARLRDGSLLLTDFVNGNYDPAGRYVGRSTDEYRGLPGGIYVARSKDNGHSWNWVSDKPLDPAPFDWIGTTERVLELPSGELLMANYYSTHEAGAKIFACALYVSNDGGNSWQYRSTMADVPGMSVNEPAMIRTASGRLIGMLRREAGPTYLLVVSDDDGHTWSAPVSSEIPARANPASLLALPDGTVLCTYGSRHDVRGMYVVASYDDGATWDVANRRIIRDDFPNWDIGYPSSVLLPDGRILAVYYFNMFDRYFIAGSFFTWERPGSSK